MSTVAEIDRAGRVVVPKKLRDALHLLPGTRLSLRLEGEAIVMQADTPASQAYRKQGLWVYRAPEAVSAAEVRDVLEHGREERESRVSGRNSAE